MDNDLLSELQLMLRNENAYVKTYRQAIDIINSNPAIDVSIILHTSVRGADRKCYNAPTADEVAAIMPGDGTDYAGERDIVVSTKQGTRDQHISTMHSTYILE